MNVMFNYIYCDGSNCKRCGHAVFADPDELAEDEVIRRIDDALDEGLYFVASQVGLPELFHWVPREGHDLHPAIADVDHGWHTFTWQCVTVDPPTDPRTLTQFLDDLERAAREGWKPPELPPEAYDPDPEPDDEVPAVPTG